MITEEVTLKWDAQYLTFPPTPIPDQALEMWQDATKLYSKSYLAWLTYVDLLISALTPSNTLSEPSRAAKKTSLQCA
jgi:hypothetical protein